MNLGFGVGNGNVWSQEQVHEMVDTVWASLGWPWTFVDVCNFFRRVGLVGFLAAILLGVWFAWSLVCLVTRYAWPFVLLGLMPAWFLVCMLFGLLGRSFILFDHSFC